MVSRSICQPTRFGVDEVVAQLRERRESALRGVFNPYCTLNTQI